MKSIFIFFCLMIMDSLYAQHERASVTEMVQNMKTYPFSDPDPVANPSDIFYPYFRFDGFSEKNRHKAQRKARFYINKCRSASCMQGGLKQASA